MRFPLFTLKLQQYSCIPPADSSEDTLRLLMSIELLLEFKLSISIV